MATNLLNDAEIARTLKLFRESDDSLFEVRLIPTLRSKNGSNTWTGYFTDIKVLLRELHKFYENEWYNGRRTNVDKINAYFTLNPIIPDCYRRANHDCFIQGAASTKDEEIIKRRWLFLDFDPERLSETSSTNEQMEKARQKAKDVLEYLKTEGFDEPIVCESGNGMHYHWPIDISNSEESKAIIKSFYDALDEYFTDTGVKIDSGNFNASRICKLYGTMAQKGYSTEDAPHRMSRILSVPKDLKPLDPSYIKKVADTFVDEKQEEEKNSYVGYTAESNHDKFCLDDWLNKYDISFRKQPTVTGTRYVLDHCPFNDDHKGREACLFVRNNGAIGFHCFHSHCVNKTWQDVRLLYEKDAYSKRDQYNSDFHNYNRNYPQKMMPKKEAHIVEKEDEPVWETMNDVLARPYEPEHIIRSGLAEFDDHFRGFKKKNVTCLSGYAGSAKSTLLSQIMVNAVDEGYNVACFSGELADTDFYRWFCLQAAGKMYCEKTDYEGYCNVPQNIQKLIGNWSSPHFWLFNNHYGFQWKPLLEQIEKVIDEKKLDLVCIDNLMMLDISDLGFKEIEQQTSFVRDLHELSQTKNVHIIVVCHPRKPNGLLGMYDVLGSSNVVNQVENVIFVYRVTQEFKNYYADFYKTQYDDNCENNGIQPGTNCYHVAKSRFGSVNDDYYSLFYEVETKRLKNKPAEYKHLSWERELDEFT